MPEQNHCVECGAAIRRRAERCRKHAMPLIQRARVAAKESAGLAKMSGLLPIGRPFGRFTIQGQPFLRAARPGGKRRWWIAARCVCGTEKTVLCQNLLKGGSQSCGCRHREVAAQQKRTHGQSRTHLYRLWQTIVTRCYYAKHKKFHCYGGRGIKVCAEWREDFEAFRGWALANGYRHGLEIDRRNNDGDYCPENCRFITHARQQRNKRTNRTLEAFGESKCLMDWVEDLRCAVTKETLTSRLRYGWAAEAAIATPAMSRRECGLTRRRRATTLKPPP